MSYDFKALANPGIRELMPYQPGKPIEELQRELGIQDVIKLASNENPLGPSPKAVAAAQQTLQQIALYPDGNGFNLKQALATHLQIDTNQITLGNGSDNVLSLLAQAFVHPEHEIMMSEYAFATFYIIAKAVHAHPLIVPANNWGHDLNAMAKAITPKTQLIFIANPNNPTGTYLTHQAVEYFLQTIPQHVIVVIDEAYAEYVQAPDYPNCLSLQKRFPNLIITRTFSKIYGLAGLRVGYGISHPDIADILNRIRLPFNVSTPGLAAACAALSDTQHVHDTLQLNQQGMSQLAQTFKQLNFDYIPSVTNFLCVNMGKPAQPIYQALLHSGIIVRPLANYGMPNHLRITIGLKQQNQRLAEALATCYS